MKRYATVLPILAAPALFAAFLRAPVEDRPVATPALDPAPAPAAHAVEKHAAPPIQVALLLDNSGSMSGLLDQARSELWTVVNALAEASHDGARPTVEVALYSYGDPPARQLVPFTTDLDRVSEALFALGIDGGDEYCGQAIDIATTQLSWSNDPRALKLMFIAGNEPFTQGPVHHHAAIAGAAQKGIVENANHCGPRSRHDGADWVTAAKLAGGAFANIDHDAVVAHVETPFDDEIARLGVALNATYVAYGTHGQEGAARQAQQDMNASSVSKSVGTARALSKASALYKNSSWDLVDAVKDGTAKVETLQDDQLPTALRGLDAAQRAQKVAALTDERAALQKSISALDMKRRDFIAAARKASAATGHETLDEAIVGALRVQAKAKGFRLPGA